MFRFVTTLSGRKKIKGGSVKSSIVEAGEVETGSVLPTLGEVDLNYQNTTELERARQLVDSIDLFMVKQKLMDKDEGQGWDEEYTAYVEHRYRRFLCMLFLRFDSSIVPTRDIDLCWHQHILDTRAYARDCQKVFGRFVHHFPYFGMRGEEDAKDLSNAFEETKAIYAQLFGEEYCLEYIDANESNCHKGPGNCHVCKSCSGKVCTSCAKK